MTTAEMRERVLGLSVRLLDVRRRRAAAEVEQLAIEAELDRLLGEAVAGPVAVGTQEIVMPPGTTVNRYEMHVEMSAPTAVTSVDLRPDPAPIRAEDRPGKTFRAGVAYDMPCADGHRWIWTPSNDRQATGTAGPPKRCLLHRAASYGRTAGGGREAMETIGSEPTIPEHGRGVCQPCKGAKVQLLDADGPWPRCSICKSTNVTPIVAASRDGKTIKLAGAGWRAERLPADAKEGT